MQRAEAEAFEQECGACERTLTDVPPAAWSSPALGAWTLAELGAHLLRGVTRVDAYLDAPVEQAEPDVDRVGYWRFDLAAAADGIAQRAREEAQTLDPLQLPALFGQGWRRSVERARRLPPDHLLTTIRGVMHLDEYIATRVVEVVVHHLDLCRALDLPPRATPTAARVTMHVLEALLGARRPRNLGRERFILAATGRIPFGDQRFPVLR